MLRFMKKILHAFLLIFAIPSSLSALDSFDIYQALEESTVRITIWEDYDSDRDKSAFFGGSGIVFNRVGDKYFILTNAHVVLEKYCLFYEEECEDCRKRAAAQAKKKTTTRKTTPKKRTPKK